MTLIFKGVVAVLEIMLVLIYLYTMLKVSRAERDSGIKVSNIWKTIIAFNLIFMIISAVFIILWK